MLRILRSLKVREWIYFALGVIFIVLQIFLDLTMPDYMSAITELAMSGASAGMAEIWKNGGLMLACALGSALSSVAVGFFAARIAAALSFRLRSSVFDKVESFSMEEINKFSTASLPSIPRGKAAVEVVGRSRQSKDSKALLSCCVSDLRNAWALR